MSAFNIVFSIVFSIIYIVMMSIMIIFERDKPRNIILWSILFLFTQALGYIAFLLSRYNFCAKKKELLTKQHEDIVYENLIANKLNNKKLKTEDEVISFNELAYNAKLTRNNSCEIIDNYEKFKKDLIHSIKSAKSYIVMELVKFNPTDFEEIKLALIAKAEEGVAVKLVHGKNISYKIKKELKRCGVKVYRFSKFYAVGGMYSNCRNQIVVDGTVAYIANTYIKKRHLQEKFDRSELILKLKGSVVEEIDVSTHKDYVFASSKFMEYTPVESKSIENKCDMLFVANAYDTDMELLIIKAICSAKKSIQLELEEFIPTESITSLLKFAINSNIDVRLIVPIKTNNHSKYFATRAYAKELALSGANVYLYDGFIRSNNIVIDSEYVLFGSFTMDREHINSSVQNILIIKDEKVVNQFNKLFDKDINNSYRINNAKYMLLREKFFKNFV